MMGHDLECCFEYDLGHYRNDDDHDPVHSGLYHNPPIIQFMRWDAIMVMWDMTGYVGHDPPCPRSYGRGEDSRTMNGILKTKYKIVKASTLIWTSRRYIVE
jgi:hypothetical protein